MKGSYYCGLGLIIFLAAGAAWLSGNSICYLNLPSLLVVTGTCIGALICNFGLRGTVSAITVMLYPGNAAAAGFRKSAAKTIMLSAMFAGLFYMIMGIIAALSNVQDLSRLGPCLATGFISLLYGCFLALLAVPTYVSEE